MSDQVGSAPPSRAGYGSVSQNEPEKSGVSSHANIGGIGHTASVGSAGEVERRASVSGREAITGTDTTENTPVKSGWTSRIKSILGIKPKGLDLGKRITQFGRKILRFGNKEERQIHQETKREVHEILDEELRAELKPLLDKAKATLRADSKATPEQKDQAENQLKGLHRKIDAHVKAQKYTAAIVPSERKAIKDELAQLYLNKATNSGKEGDDARIAELEAKGRLVLPKLKEGATKEEQEPVVREKLVQLLANQKRMELYSKELEKRITEYKEKFEKLTNAEQSALGSQISDCERNKDDAQLVKLLRHPAHMTEKESQEFSASIEKTLGEIVASEAFLKEVEDCMTDLNKEDSSAFYEKAQAKIDDINKEIVRDSAFLKDIKKKPGSQKDSFLIQVLFPFRGDKTIFKDHKTEFDSLGALRLALGSRSILDCVPQPLSKKEREALSSTEKKTAGKIKRPLGDVKSFDIDKLKAEITNDEKKLAELKTKFEKSSPDKSPDTDPNILKMNLIISSKKINLRMQVVMSDIKTRLDGNKIDATQAKKELIQLHGIILTEYDDIRKKYSDAEMSRKQESLSLMLHLSGGALPSSDLDFTPSTLPGLEIADALMTQIWESMGFSEKDDMIDRLVEGFQSGSVQVRNELRHQIRDLKSTWKDDLPDHQKSAIRSELYPLIMKLELYEMVSVIENMKSTDTDGAIEVLHSRLKKQQAAFQEKVPGSVNYGDVSKLADLSTAEFANVIGQMIGRL